MALTPAWTAARKAILGIEAHLVVHAPLLRIAQDVVRFLHVLEAVLGGFIPGIQVRVILAGELPVSLPKFFVGGAFGNSQRFVIIVFWARRHGIGSDRIQQESGRPSLVLLLIVNVYEFG